MMKKPELLAPAGDMQALKTAVNFGADAVYVGGPLLQLRSQKTGFTLEDISNGAEYVHAHGKKIYVTVNSFVKGDELDDLVDYCKKLNRLSVDAVIVSDLGAISLIRKFVPDLEVHVSTQANCMNYQTAMVYREMGAKRVVLAREMSMDEIRELRKKLPCDTEIEAFVHGAMCMSYSGRCFISRYLTDRSGNRGECTQPCRWSYHLVEMKRPNEFFPIEETETGTNILSSRDMCCIDFMDELIEAGVISFKIEGRMKSPYYVATVVNAYRRAIDHSAPIQALRRELECISHRPYSSGFYFGKMKDYIPDEQMPYTRECTFAGVVKGFSKGVAEIEQRGKFCVGDVVGVVSPNSIGVSFEIKRMENSGHVPVESAPHAQETIFLDCPDGVELSPGDMIRIESRGCSSSPD